MNLKNIIKKVLMDRGEELLNPDTEGTDERVAEIVAIQIVSEITSRKFQNRATVEMSGGVVQSIFTHPWMMVEIIDDDELEDLPPMEAFEVTLEGFDGSTDETDHLILWIKAKDYDAVRLFVENKDFKETHTQPVASIIHMEDRSDLGYDDGIDYIVKS